MIDLEGKQVADMVVFNEHNHSEKISPSYTRSDAGKHERPVYWIAFRGITTGHRLISTMRTHMLTITADTQVPGGIHDFVLRLCSSFTFERTGFEPAEGCLELLTRVLEPYAIAQGDIPDPMNIFMNVPYDPTTGMFRIDEPITRPGDYVEFKAEMDCLIAITACPEFGTMCNGRPPHRPKPIKIEVFEE